MADLNKPVGSAGEVLRAFIGLGFTSFGGPVAHLGYFRTAFVERRAWLSDTAYGELVALCQFLPGPASSQVGFALGWMRAGPLGALAAWAAFTLPSALALVLVAFGAALFEGATGAALLQGLKLVAVAVVAHALWGMARALCPDAERASLAVLAAIAMLLFSTALMQVAVILVGGLAGLWLCRNIAAAEEARLDIPVSRPLALSCLGLFFVLLVGLPLIAELAPAIGLFDAFYRAGALVFGGGHVVLPLLEAEVVGEGGVSADAFLAGYGAAQAVPGPLFTFGAYLGAVMESPPNGVIGAAIALVAVFVPGFLLLIGVLPFWSDLASQKGARAALAGANAAVVGLLGAALYDPVWTSAVLTPRDFAFALAGFALLTVWKASPLIVVALLAVGNMAVSFLP
ncbi:MAG: chromate efflux transporter [Pseudomonadota bacterium]